MNTNQWIIISIVIIAIVGSIIYYYNNSQILYLHNITTHPTSIGLDKFGINEIYSTKPGGERWYFNTTDPNTDPRVGKAEDYPTTFVQRNDDGSWKVTSTKVRYGITTSSGWHSKLITTLNQQELSAKGICSRLTIGRM